MQLHKNGIGHSYFIRAVPTRLRCSVLPYQIIRHEQNITSGVDSCNIFRTFIERTKKLQRREGKLRIYGMKKTIKFTPGQPQASLQPEPN